VFIQFCWWSFLIYDLNLEVHELQLKLDISNKIEFERALKANIWMILGEGTVFLTLLFLGFYQVKKAFQREVALAEQQRNFLLSVTHELNSPLASVKLYLQTLLSRKIDEEKQRQILSNALSENERLHKLVDNVLIATRLDNSTFSLYFETIDWSEFVKQTITNNPKSKNRLTTLNIEHNIVAPIDKTALGSIINNLVENAIKYTPEEKEIICSLSQNKDEILLQVIDQGQGIPENEKANIFKKFYRVGSEETRKSKGTGLGLYIVHFLVKSLNGTITVKNNLPNGTIFSVTFPKGSLQNHHS
tara:strand:+ start:5161 stop:6069 length:909 start_codon:yes stop_codon:yes gene_type:complete